MPFIDLVYLLLILFQLFPFICFSCSISFSSDVLTCSQFCTTGLESLLSSKCRISPELLVSVIIFFSSLTNTYTHTHTTPSTPFIPPLQTWKHILSPKSSSLRPKWFGSCLHFAPQTAAKRFMAAVWFYFCGFSEFSPLADAHLQKLSHTLWVRITPFAN